MKPVSLRPITSYQRTTRRQSTECGGVTELLKLENDSPYKVRRARPPRKNKGGLMPLACFELDYT